MGEEGAVEWVEVEPGVRVRAGDGAWDRWAVPAEGGDARPRWTGAGSDRYGGVSDLPGPPAARLRGAALGTAARWGRTRWALAAAAGALGLLVLVRVLGDLGGLSAPATAMPPGGDGVGAAATPVPAPRELSWPSERLDTSTESPGPAGADAAPVEQVSDWWEVVGILDERRTAALEALDERGVGRYAAEGSAAWSADLALIEDLRGRGVTPVGLATDLIAIESAPSLAPVDEQQGAGDPRAVGSDPEGGGGVSLVIVDRRSAYELQDSSGATVAGVPASAARRWRLTLVPGGEGDDEVAWRVASIDALP